MEEPDYMEKLTKKAVIAATLAANLSLVSAATPAIGVAFSNGNILINHATAVGNASLFEGNVVETGDASSRLHLKNGADLQLSTESRGTFYTHRMVLEKGAVQFRASDEYGVEARNLKIIGTDIDTAARVSMHGGVVQVASLTGHVQVTNATGQLVANIAPGMAFDFAPQDQGASAPPSTPVKGAKVPAVSGTTAAAAGAAHTATLIVAGVVVVAAVGTTAGVLATNGESSSAPNVISPQTSR